MLIEICFNHFLGDMGLHTLPKEARTTIEDRAMDDEDEPWPGGQRDAAENAGRHARWNSPRTSGTNSG